MYPYLWFCTTSSISLGCLKVFVWLGGGILVHTITSTLGQVQVWLGCNIKIITLQSWYVQIKTNVRHINKSQPVSTLNFFVPQVCTPGKHIECSLSHDLVPDYLTQYLMQYLTQYWTQYLTQYLTNYRQYISKY